jgi:ribosomal protein L4
MNPYQSDWYKVDIAWVNYLEKNYEAAVDEINRLPMPNVDAQLILAASQAQLAERRSGSGEAQLASLAKQIAKRALKQALFRLPRWTTSKEERRSPFKNPEDLQHWLDGLRKAGLP